MQKPNFVFFFTDDQRFDTIRALGCSAIETPNIDWLVENGVSFTQAHIPGGTSGAVCMPSRAMLHTGRSLFHLGESPDDNNNGQVIPEPHALLGETLRGAGYRTFGTGKWHNGPRAYSRSFTDGGEIMFGGMADHWNVPAHSFDPSGEYAGRYAMCPDPFRSNRVQVQAGDHVTAGKHSSELFCDEALRFLKGYDSTDPFFMYVSFMAPHDPRTMPEQFLKMYDPDSIELPENFMPEHPFDLGTRQIRDEVLADHPRDPAEIRCHIAEYYAMITHLDHEMGRVIEGVRESGRMENTVFVFAGDNGLGLGQHGLLGKQNLYDHSVRVPLVFAGGDLPRGVQSPSLVYHFDIFPTLCELADLEIPGSVEGVSLVPAMRDTSLPVRESLYLAYIASQRGVRMGDHKLIESRVEGASHTQVFNLAEDPKELKNLADDPESRAQLEQLRSELDRLRHELDDVQPEFGGTFWGSETS